MQYGLQSLLQEHMHELHGMQHVATIDLPFSDERAPRPAQQAPESAAFMARIQAAARQVPCPHYPNPARPIFNVVRRMCLVCAP